MSSFARTGEQLSFPDEEPRVYKPEAGELSPWQKAQLDRFYVELDQTAADTQIKRARASARIRADDENRAAEHRDRDERRKVELVAHCVAIAVFALAAIVLSIAALGSPQTEVRLSPVAAVALVAGLRALRPGGRSSIWDWLMRREPST